MVKNVNSFFNVFVKKYLYWFVTSIVLLAGSVMLSIDPYLVFSELLYKTGVALFVLTLAFTIRRTILGYVEWKDPYDKIYALVIVIVVAIIFTFTKVPQVSFINL